MSDIRCQVLDGVSTPWGIATHLRMWRTDNKNITLSWSDIQKIKNEALGEDVTVVEFYPEQHLVVDEVNIRHFWTVDLQPPMRP